jgi:hypothetical protein
MTEMNTFPYDDVVFACTHLCDLLEVENEALSVHDPVTVRELSDNKAALARLYEQSMRPLFDDPTVIDDLPAEQREELKELGGRLKELVEINARRLKAEMAACQTVMEIVVGAVKQNTVNTNTYGRGGHFDALQKGAAGNSISFNKTL